MMLHKVTMFVPGEPLENILMGRPVVVKVSRIMSLLVRQLKRLIPVLF